MSSHRSRLGIVLLVLIVLGLLLAPQSGQAADRYIMVVDADGAIVPAMEDYIDRALDRAEDDDVGLVIIRLDTPGGSVMVTEDIVQRIRGAEVPVVVYVAPRGSMAASAGALITLSGHASAMAPETVIGAASPISGDGSDLNETADKKAKEILTANMRTLTEHRSEAAQNVAVDMITDAKAVTATEAMDIGLIDYIAEDNDDLIAQMDGRTLSVGEREFPLELAGLETREVNMSLIEQILLMLTDPTLVFLLLSTGALLIIIEFRAPGGWVAGTLGAVMVALSLYGLGVLPVNFLGLVFIGLAFLLFLFEIQVPETQGALSIAGAVCLAAGGLIMFNNADVAQFGGISWIVVIGQSAAIGTASALLLAWLVRSIRRMPSTGNTGMIGMIGYVRMTLEPQGMVFVNGERWQAETTNGIHISDGEPVRVVEVEDLKLLVEPVDPLDLPDKRKNES
ncbi:MAG: nodulation protein NfeD [Chloroflexi bacterium]|nr:nodulation protein NfeD [Chloroflexota bacterium]